jgi:hypothetical protein
VRTGDIFYRNTGIRSTETPLLPPFPPHPPFPRPPVRPNGCFRSLPRKANSLQSIRRCFAFQNRGPLQEWSHP